MTDEGRIGDPIDMVEAMNAFANMAAMNWKLFVELKDQGFSESQALKLCAAYLHGAGGGKLESA